MAEPMIREAAVESQRLRDRLEDQNRTAFLEKAHAILQTRFDAFVEEYRDRGVSEDDLKALKREIEGDMQKTFGDFDTLLEEKTRHQSNEILGKVEGMFIRFQAQTTNDQLAQSNALLKANAETRKEIIRYGIGFALTIISALVIFYLTRNG